MAEESNQECVDIESFFKNIKSVDEYDFDNLDNFIKGKTPEDIQEQCLKVCKDYLAGIWNQQTVDTIEVRRITGGFVNQLYYCGIRHPNNSEGAPQEVAVRFYGDNFDETDKTRIRDLVISLTFSEKKLGPKVYGIFEGGQIQKYIKHRQFKREDQDDPELVKKVFRTLAVIHSLEIPLKKNQNILQDMVNKSMDDMFEKLPINQLIEEFNCQTMKKYDLRDELNWITGVIERVNSPVMFTHNDFRASNIMITESNDELVVCDYDLSSYGYRGNDFLALIREWGRNPFDIKSVDGLLLDSQFKPMIQIYVEECETIYGKNYSQNPINSVDHILKEAKVFLLNSFLLFTFFMIRRFVKKEDEAEPPNYKLMMEFAELSHKNYITIKEILNKQNLFD